jgi:hypothetical protein
MKRIISAAVQAITPPVVWNAYLHLRGLGQRYPWRQFKCMGTCSNTKPLFDGKFTELYNKYGSLDPAVDVNSSRYLSYNICFFANLCRLVPGDFVCAGVSYGVAARMVFDFVDLAELGKTLHLIDPFEGITSNDSSKASSTFNRDPDYVLRQYPPGSPIILHRKRVPLRLPGPLAFVFADTGNPKAEAESIPIFYEALSPGGMIITDQYGNYIEYYESILNSMGVVPFWLPSGQGVIVKQ